MKIYSLRKAVSEAVSIRNELLKEYLSLEDGSSNMLIGACGLASVLLSIRLEDAQILRYGNSDLFGHHIWTEVNDTIIDITACQFNGIRTSKNQSRIYGVLVTKSPKPYHSNVRKTGMDVYLKVLNENWYTKEDYANWPNIAEHFL